MTARHWPALLRAMGRPELECDPRFGSNGARVAHRAALEARPRSTPHTPQLNLVLPWRPLMFLVFDL
jgi:hypothetical protein